MKKIRIDSLNALKYVLYKGEKIQLSYVLHSVSYQHEAKHLYLLLSSLKYIVQVAFNYFSIPKNKI